MEFRFIVVRNDVSIAWRIGVLKVSEVFLALLSFYPPSTFSPDILAPNATFNSGVEFSRFLSAPPSFMMLLRGEAELAARRAKRELCQGGKLIGPVLFPQKQCCCKSCWISCRRVGNWHGMESDTTG